MLSRRDGTGQQPQALRHHEGGFISIQFIPFHLTFTLSLAFPQKQQPGLLSNKLFHMLQTALREQGEYLLALHPD